MFEFNVFKIRGYKKVNKEPFQTYEDAEKWLKNYVAEKKLKIEKFVIKCGINL